MKVDSSDEEEFEQHSVEEQIEQEEERVSEY